MDRELLEQTLGGWDHDGDSKRLRDGGAGGGQGASPVQSLQLLEVRSATHPAFCLSSSSSSSETQSELFLFQVRSSGPAPLQTARFSGLCSNSPVTVF